MPRYTFIFALLLGAGLIFAPFFSGCRGPSAEDALFRQAMIALDEGMEGAASEYLTQFLVRYPKSDLLPEVLWQRGTIYALYQNRYTEAISDYRELLEVAPKSSHAFEAQKAIAQIFEQKLDNCRRAIVEYQRLISDFETVVGDDEFQFRIAHCFYTLLNFDQSILEYQILIDRYPASPLVPEAYFQIATVLQTAGALEPAEDAWKNYLARYPGGEKVVDARFGLAATLEEQERLDEALGMYQEIFDQYPNKDAITWRIEKVQRRMEERGR